MLPNKLLLRLGLVYNSDISSTGSSLCSIKWLWRWKVREG